MNLETKITIYKFTPQLFTLTRYSLLHIAVTISHFMDNRSLQLSLQVGIQIYLYLFHSILFTVVHYFGSQHPLFLLFF